MNWKRTKNGVLCIYALLVIEKVFSLGFEPGPFLNTLAVDRHVLGRLEEKADQ